MQAFPNSDASLSQVLLVDDDQSILLVLYQALLAAGYKVTTATNGQEALRLIRENRPDLVLLDLMMPLVDGFTVIKEVRSHLSKDLPIIVLSARGEDRTKVEVLDLGANDYITKPFSTEELMARIRVALRTRSRLNPAGEVTPANSSVFTDGFLTIDFEKQRVLREDKELKLTPKQYELLRYMTLNAGKLLTHQVLLEEVWGSEYSLQTQYLHVFIGQLRQKIELDAHKPEYIVTEPGKGYRFQLKSQH
ncbi:MAG TPA: response regulator transcription factor [Chloroflexia bacterium]|nr:response regulator transcription factor [Chloroflexia bacterium]